MRKAAVTASDLLGAGKLGISAAIGITDLVEQMHLTISRRPLPLGPAIEGPAGGVADFVYEGVRRAFASLEPGLDLLVNALGPSENVERSPKRDVALAALNGVVGDSLVAAGNPLAIGMQFRKDGRALTLERAALAAAVPKASGRVVVLVHGLCFSDLQWTLWMSCSYRSMQTSQDQCVCAKSTSRRPSAQRAARFSNSPATPWIQA